MLEKRSLGRRGLTVGVVGIGCEGLLKKPYDFYVNALDMMEEAGANCVDLYSPNPDMRSGLGEALSGRREKFILQGHLCSTWEDDQYKCVRDLATVKRSFEDQLTRLKTDYLDIGMIHYVDSDASWEKVLDEGVLDYALELRQKGVVRALGLSSHNPLVAMRAIKEANLEVLMFSVNPLYDLQPPDEDVEQLWNREKYKDKLTNMDPERKRLYETCMEMGVGITVMKAFGGGDLLRADKSLAGVALSANQAIAYALDRPAVACVLAGVHSLEELKECLDFANANAEQKNYADVLAKFPLVSWKGECAYCGHCAPCVAKIDIAMTTKLLNLALAQKEIPETVREHYAAMPHKGGECRECGVCETRCPFEVAIRENMARAKKVFGE